MCKPKLVSVLLIGIIAFGVFLTYVSPAQARDRAFIDLSLDFLGEYQLPQTDFDPPISGISAITYDRKRDRLIAVCGDAPARFYTLKLTLDRTDAEKIGIHTDVESVTFLTDKDGKPYSKGTINPGGVALTPQKTLFISSDGTPSVQEFDLNGKLQTSLPIPDHYLLNTEHTKGIQDNLGFAALTLNPTGTIPATGEPIRLFTATESALIQDRELPNSTEKTKSRFLHYLIGFGPPVVIAEHFYPLENPATNLVELLAISAGGHFLSLEQSEGVSGSNIKIFQMTTGGATDTSGITSLKGALTGTRPLKKKLLFDLNKLGIPLDNLQGMAFGPRLSDGTQSLLLVSNNTQQATQLLLFRLNQPQSEMTIRSKLKSDR